MVDVRRRVVKYEVGVSSSISGWLVACLSLSPLGSIFRRSVLTKMRSSAV